MMIDMDFDLSDDHRLIQRTVRDFADNEVAPVAEELDRHKQFPYEIVRKLGGLGLMGIPFPEEYGGGGGGKPGHADPRGGLTRRGAAATRWPTRSPSRSSRAWTRAWPSRCARTPRWARSRSTSSAPRSRSAS